MTPAFPARWSLRSPVLIAETFSSRIWRAGRTDGTSVVVKALNDFPDVEEELRGAHYLRWRDGHGAVRLFDLDGTAMLLEDAGDRTLHDFLRQRGDDAATFEAARLAADLFGESAVPPPPELQPLRARFSSLFKRAALDGAGRRRHDALYRDAALLAERLLARERDDRPLHGDLHHDNIMLSPRGWLAIDPKGLLGDPAFDLANFFYNPIDASALCADPKRVRSMAGIFSAELAIGLSHILDFAFAWGCLSASWHAEDGNEGEEDRELGIAAAVRSVRAAP